MTCWIEVTIKSPHEDLDGRKEWKNMALFETIRVGNDGVTELWRDGRAALVHETPAQIVALTRAAASR